MKDELDILSIISLSMNAGEGNHRNLHCPTCGGVNSHIDPPYLVVGESWHGTGDLAITQLWSECGSRWEICIGADKGAAPIFIRVIKSCRDAVVPA